MSGINGGHIMTTGFAHGTVLANAQKVISAIRQGKIKHIFLVGAVTEHSRDEIIIRNL